MLDTCVRTLSNFSAILPLCSLGRDPPASRFLLKSHTRLKTNSLPMMTEGII